MSPSLRSILHALPYPVALARDRRVLDANEALRSLVGADPTGACVDELALPPGTRIEEAALDDGSFLCSFRGPLLDIQELGTRAASQLLLDAQHDPVSVTDTTTGRFIDVNEPWCQQYGYTRDEAIGRMGPADVSAEPDATRASIATRTQARTTGTTGIRWHRRKDGSVFPVEIHCGVVHLGGRDLVYARLTSIEERVRAEDALRRSEENYRTLIELLPHAVFVHRNERMLYMNPAARRMLGFEPDEPIDGFGIYDIVHPDDRAVVVDRVRTRLYRGEVAPTREERLVCRDGNAVWVEIVGIPTLFDGEPAGLAFAQDITARKEMKKQLVTSDRLASLGRLAASVGHEINNPLMYVLGSLELVRRDLEKGPLSAERIPVVLERVADAEEGALRVRDIVRDLRSLARTPADDGQPAELTSTLEACVKMAGHELRHRAHVVREYGPEPVWVRGSEARLGQVFLNLLVNAAQAITEGSLDENEVRIRVTRDAEDAIVEVLDTGRGLPEEADERLFEPFFTTNHGNGTGLGLSIAHHIVIAIGGSIEAERRSRGSCFRVRLPLADPPADVEEPARDYAVGGAQRILVVDDEPEICALLREWLAGYTVVTAKSGREALALIALGERFDLIVCDLMMGDLTGMDVHARLAGGEDAPRFLFTTGGTYTERATRFVESLDVEPLHKPVGREELLRAVDRALSAD